MAWDKKKYFRDRQAKLRWKAKEYDKLMAQPKPNPLYNAIADEDIGDLKQLIAKSWRFLQLAIDEKEEKYILRVIAELKAVE